MSIPGAASPLFLSAAAAADAAGYQIDRSLRFNSADTAYLNRTPSSAGSRKTWTWSGWVKLSKINSINTIFAAGSGIWSGGQQTVLTIYDNNTLWLFDYNGGYQYQKRSSAVFRDPSAWQHIVVAVDTTDSTAADRVKLYVNGERISDFASSSDPASDYQTFVNNNVAHYVSLNSGAGLDGYLAEVHFIDGQALAPTDFGQTNSDNNWDPKEYSGTYGTNGFYLKFADNSSAAALGTDSSGNSNTFTVNNLSLGTSAQVTVYLTHTGGAVSSGAFNASIGSVSSLGSYSGDTWTATNTGWVDTWDFSSDTGVTSFTLSNWSVGSYSNQKWYLSNDSSFASAVDGPNSGNPASGTHSLEVSGTRYRYCRIQNVPSATYSIVGNSSTPGAGCDSLIDTPTNYTADSGNNGGNYCTWNPLTTSEDHTLSNGNLDSSFDNSTPTKTTIGTIGMTSGKFYWETTLNSQTGSSSGAGGLSAVSSGMDRPGFDANTWFYSSTNGRIYTDNGQTDYGDSYSPGDVIGTAFDADNGKLYFYKNGVVQNSGTAAATGLTSGPYFPAIGDISVSNQFTTSTNFGQRPFTYTPPTGYVSLCTQNLSDPTIADGSTAFDVDLWNGDGNATKTVTTSFSPGFVWAKSRTVASNHQLSDVVRGNGKVIFSNTNGAEGDYSTFGGGGISSLGTNQFVISQGSSTNNNLNQNNSTGVAWYWDAGASTVSNTDGSITSNVRANASTGFSIVGYTGTGSAATVGHGLNATPSLLIVKSTTRVASWTVYHSDLTDASYFLRLDVTDGQSQASGKWNSTAPTNSVFSIGTAGTTNTDTEGYIAYCFAPVAGYSAFGSYTGNGSADGPFVFTGFRPRWIMRKRTDAANYGWYLIDTARDSYNLSDAFLDAADSDAEGTGAQIDILSNGFKLRTSSVSTNASGGTYIYACFASHPFRTARAR